MASSEASAAPRERAFSARAALLVLLVAGVAGVAIGAGLHFALAGSTPLRAGGAASASASPARSQGLRGEAVWAPGAQPAPPITTLRDQSGRLFSLAALRGHPVAVTFFDSHCNQACPLEGRALAAAEQALPASERPVVLVVSVNPLDTPSSVRAAARRWGLAGAGAWHWLWGGRARLAQVWSAYHIFVHPTKADIVHTEALYLLDRHLDERSGYLYPFLPGSVSHDLAILARTHGHV